MIFKLKRNKNISFIGVQLTGKGFVLSKEEAKKLISKNPQNGDCIKNFLIGRDLNQNWEIAPTRMVIDFQDWSLEKAKKYSDLMNIVETKVKQERLANKCTGGQIKKIKKYWWQHKCLAVTMRQNLENLDRFIVTSRVSVHRVFVMIENDQVLPDNTAIAIASNSYSFLGILSSKFHVEWTKYNSSSLGEGIRYTNTTCFETFPFPENKESSKVSSLMKKIEFYRRRACASHKHGLTTLYNHMFDGGHRELKGLHKQLDEAVADLYHFPKEKLSCRKSILRFLKEKNREQSEKEKT